MFEIKLAKVLSFSSEDQIYKADNLIDADPKKWLGLNDHETKQYIIIKLEKTSQIQQIDIENASSAFIEVLAGNESDQEDDFTVILPPVSFMTPTESKNQLHPNRLKLFIGEANLVKETLNKTWDRIKLVCTQPFNTNIQFGISSVKVYSQATVDEDKLDAAKLNTGVFELKKELSNSVNGPEETVEHVDEIKVGSVFQKWKNSETKKDSKPIPENESDSNLKRKKPLSDEEVQVKISKVTKETKVEASTSNNRVNARPNQILRGVVFVLSGFQNPLRSEIRDKGCKLGAKYRPEWNDDECTHLICAFPNTPKANQVKESGGKIVTKEWLYECEKSGKLLDCEEFKLKEKSESDESDSDGQVPRKAAKKAVSKITKLKVKDEFDDSIDEEEAENSDDRDFIVNSSEEEISSSSSSSSSSGSSPDSDSVVTKKKAKKTKKSKKIKKDKKKKRTKSSSSSESESDLEAYKLKKEKQLLKKKLASKNKTNEKENKKVVPSKKKEITYEDDEVKELTKKLSDSSNKTEANSDLETDVVIKKLAVEAVESWELPSFFEGKNFYIYGDFDSKKRNFLTRTIIAFGGDLHDYMSDSIDFVITNKQWNKEFEQSKKENKKLVIVNEDWIVACSRRKKLLAHQAFEVENDD